MVDPIVVLMALLCGFVVSLISFCGLATLSTSVERVRNISQYLVALAAGVMIGGAVMHMLPKAVEELGGLPLVATVTFTAGIILSYVLETALEWHHCRQIGGCVEPSHRHTIGLMNLYGDGVHNLIDGLAIGVSFLYNPLMGLSITLAVALHEIPQELGDFGVLLQAGYTRKKALIYNFISALTAMAGIAAVFMAGYVAQSILPLLLPFAAGNFIYISLTDLMPELHKERRTKRTLLQFAIMITGLTIMTLLLQLHHD